MQFLIAAVLLVGTAALVPQATRQASAYSAAQAEAQSDPYDFPNVELCCKKRPQHVPYCVRHPGAPQCVCRRDPDNPICQNGDGPPDGDHATVSCGGPRKHAYPSIATALAALPDKGGRIRLWNWGCDPSITGLVIDRAVVIEPADRAQGERAGLYGGGCASVAPHHAGAVVSLRNLDIEGCFVVRRGRLDLQEVNLASRSTSDAVRVDGGSLSATDSTIRARGIAINAVRGAMISLNRGRFASGPNADQVVYLDVDRADLRGAGREAPLLIKGGEVGVRIGLNGRYPVKLGDVQIQRGDHQDIQRFGWGEAGVVVGGAATSDDFPTLPGLPGASFSFKGGDISGYEEGLVLSGGLRSEVEGVSVTGARRGIAVGAGVLADLKGNRIMRSKRVGIDLEGGAIGTAYYNIIHADRGECVCYDGDCTSRRDRVFGHGAFQMYGTDCDD
jgi:hypothetical protein